MKYISISLLLTCIFLSLGTRAGSLASENLKYHKEGLQLREGAANKAGIVEKLRTWWKGEDPCVRVTEAKIVEEGVEESKYRSIGKEIKVDDGPAIEALKNTVDTLFEEEKQKCLLNKFSLKGKEEKEASCKKAADKAIDKLRSCVKLVGEGQSLNATKLREEAEAIKKAAEEAEVKKQALRDKPDEDKNKILSADIKTAHMPLTKAYIDADAVDVDIGGKLLLLAASENNVSAIKLLLDRKVAKVDARSDGAQETPLILAAKQGHLAAMKVLIERGANVEDKDADDQTPLLALMGGESKDVSAATKLLLQRGALVDAKDRSGATPLMMAAMRGKEANVRWLIGKKANVNAQESVGRTPLMLAASDGYVSIMQALIEGNADVDAKTITGYTVLMFAASGGHLEAVKLLLKYNAKIDEYNEDNKTALDLASTKEIGEAILAQAK